VSSARAQSGSTGAGPWRAFASTFFLLLLLYLRTNHPFVANADNAEFQTMAATGGIAHAGYPTYVLALLAFGKLGWSTFAFRANLLGCLCGAVAAAFAAFHGTRLSGHAWAGAAAGVALGLSYQLWQSSTAAEIYAFTLVLAAALFLLARRLALQPSGPAAFAAGAIGGLGIGSHLTILALGPVVVLALVAGFRRTGRVSRGVLVALIAGFVLGLAPLAYQMAQDRPDRPMNYLALKRLPGPEREVPPPALGERAERMAQLLSGRQYFGQYGSVRGLRSSLVRFRYVFLDLILNEFFLIGVPLAAIGVWRLARRRDLDGALLATWMASSVFLIWYAAVLYDMAATYFIYGSWILAIAISVGLAALAERARWLGGAAALCLVAAPIVRLIVPSPAKTGWVALTWSRLPAQWNPWIEDRSWEVYGHGVLRALPPRAVLLSNWSEGMTMNYAHYAEGMRGDVDIVLTENPRELAHYSVGVLALRRPCFTTLAAAETTDIPGSSIVRAGEWARGGLWSVALAEAATQDSVDRAVSPVR
jgi:hypothetical protein